MINIEEPKNNILMIFRYFYWKGEDQTQERWLKSVPSNEIKIKKYLWNGVVPQSIKHKKQNALHLWYWILEFLSHPLSCPGEASEAIIEESSLLRLEKEIIH